MTYDIELFLKLEKTWQRTVDKNRTKSPASTVRPEFRADKWENSG